MGLIRQHSTSITPNIRQKELYHENFIRIWKKIEQNQLIYTVIIEPGLKFLFHTHIPKREG